MKILKFKSKYYALIIVANTMSSGPMWSQSRPVNVPLVNTRTSKMTSKEKNSNDSDKNGGIGAYLLQRQGKFFEIHSILRNGPCDKAGIENGDQISEIDGKSMEKISYQEVSNLVRGSIGSKVRLKIVKSDGTVKEVSIERIDISGNLAIFESQNDYSILSGISSSLDRLTDDPSRWAENASIAGDFIGAKAIYLNGLNYPPPTSMAIGQTIDSTLWHASSFFLSCGCFDEANSFFMQLIDNSKDYKFQYIDHDCFWSLVVLLEKLGRVEDAELICKNMIKAGNKILQSSYWSKEALKEYSRFLFRQGRKTEIANLLMQIKSFKEENFSLADLEYFGDTEYQLGLFENAAEYYLQAAKQYEQKTHDLQRQSDKDRPLIKLLYKAADAYYANKNYSQAEQVCEEVIKKQKIAIPKDLEPSCERKLELHPATSALLIQHGDICKASGQIERANADYKNAQFLRQVALNSASPWIKEAQDRLNASPDLLASRKIEIINLSYAGERALNIQFPSTLSAYTAIKTEAANRLDLAKKALNEMKSSNDSELNSCQIAQIFTLVDLEQKNSSKTAQELLHLLQESSNNSSKFLARLNLCVYDEWLSIQSNSSAEKFTKTISMLNEILPKQTDQYPQHGVPIYEKLRWLANEWRIAGHAEIALALLECAQTLRDGEMIQNSDHSRAWQMSIFDSLRKQDFCLAYLDKHDFAAAKKLVSDETLNAGQICENSKWLQICNSLEKTNQWKTAEKYLSSLKSSTKEADQVYVSIRLSELYLTQGKLIEAENEARSIKTGATFAWKAYAVIAESLDKQNKLESSIPVYLRAGTLGQFSDETIDSLKKKEGCLKRALQLQEQLYGTCDPRIIETLTVLTSICQKLGKKEEIREICERIISIQKNSFKTPEDELKFWQLMVGNYLVSQQTDKAIEAQHHVAELTKKNSQSWGNDYQILANLELTKGQFKEALSDAKTYIASPAFVSESRKIGTIGSIHDRFCEKLIKAGYVNDVLELIQLAITITQRVNGPYDRSTYNFFVSLAKVQAMSKQFIESENTCNIFLDKFHKSQFNEPQTESFSSGNSLGDLTSIANIFSEQGKDELSLKLLNKILQLQKEFLGPANCQIANTESAIAKVYMKQEKFLEAKPHAWNALEIYTINYGSDWHAICHYVNDYANILRKLESSQELEALKKKYSCFDSRTIDLSSINRQQKITFFRLNQVSKDEARNKLLAMAREEESFSSANSSNTVKIIEQLITLETNSQNYEVVIDLRKRLLKILSFTDSPKGKAARKQMQEIAQLYKKLGRRDEADREIKEIIGILESIPAEAKSISDKFDQAQAYLEIGDKAKTLTLVKLLSQQMKEKENSQYIQQCSELLLQLGELEEAAKLKTFANEIWKKQHEEMKK